jgi:hypothetical protein
VIAAFELMGWMEFVARSRQVYMRLVVEALLYLPKGKRTSIYAITFARRRVVTVRACY